MKSDLIDTEFLILKKTAYSETSLIVSGITPDYGQMRLMVKGARQLGKNKFPQIDLLRLVSLRCRKRNTALHVPSAVDLLIDYRKVANNYKAYQTACWLAAFAMHNIPEDVEHRRVFIALKYAFERLCIAADKQMANQQSLQAVKVGFCIVYLDESGLLPQYAGDDVRRRQRRKLLEFGEGKCQAPNLTADAWKKIYTWVLELCELD